MLLLLLLSELRFPAAAKERKSSLKMTNTNGAMSLSAEEDILQVLSTVLRRKVLPMFGQISAELIVSIMRKTDGLL